MLNQKECTDLVHYLSDDPRGDLYSDRLIHILLDMAQIQQILLVLSLLPGFYGWQNQGEIQKAQDKINKTVRDLLKSHRKSQDEQ